MENEQNNKILTVTITEAEKSVLDALRRLKPYGSMKVSKNQNGTQFSISLEDHWVVAIKKIVEKRPKINYETKN